MYEIAIRGRLPDDWAYWFEGFEATRLGQNTMLRGRVADQAALHGVIAQLRDLALPLIWIHELSDPAATE
jgi:hypothetical protein